MDKPFYVVNEKKDSAEILIYGVIGSSFWDEESVSAKSFIKDFKALRSKFSSITIRLNTPGGSVWDGLPIYNEISTAIRDGFDIKIIVDGIAYSMGAYFAISSKNTQAYQNSILMFHSAIGGVMGNKNDLIDASKQLVIIEDNIADRMAEMSGSSKDEILKTYFDGRDHFLSAKEAFDLGFISEVINENSSAKMPNNVLEMKMSDIYAFYESKNLFPSPGTSKYFFAKVSNLLNRNSNQNSQTDMNKETQVAINVLLGIDMDADDKKTVETVKNIIEQKKTIEQELIGLKEANESLKTQNSNLSQQITAKDTEIANLNAELGRTAAAEKTSVDSQDPDKAPKNTVVLDEINEYAQKFVTPKKS